MHHSGSQARSGPPSRSPARKQDGRGGVGGRRRARDHARCNDAGPASAAAGSAACRPAGRVGLQWLVAKTSIRRRERRKLAARGDRARRPAGWGSWPLVCVVPRCCVEGHALASLHGASVCPAVHPFFSALTSTYFPPLNFSNDPTHSPHTQAFPVGRTSALSRRRANG